jgi:hypothetical protein
MYGLTGQIYLDANEVGAWIRCLSDMGIELASFIVVRAVDLALS